MNELWNNKNKIKYVSLPILHYVIPQRTAQFLNAILYYNTILKEIKSEFLYKLCLEFWSYKTSSET